jgi:carbon-monoxide dehydrogenase medium subunit
VKPPPFLYARPETVDDAVSLLAQSGEEAKILAGGQSLVPLLNFRLARPSVLVDLGGVADLSYIRREEGTLAVGAMTRLLEAERSQDAATASPMIRRALRHVGHLQIRTRGTVGGSIAHADPAAELPAVAVATGADMIAKSQRGRRTITASEFFQGPFMTALDPDEVLTEIRFPSTDGAGTAFVELARRSGDFALGGVAAVVRTREDSSVDDVRLVALGMGGHPIRLTEAEDRVRGVEVTEDVLREAGEAASRQVDPFTDVHADAEYRRELAGTLVRRALREAVG